MTEDKEVFKVLDNKWSLISIYMLLLISSLVDGLDVSIVNVSLPKIALEFGITVEDCSWILNAYIIGIAAFLFLFAKLADTGRLRKVFLYGVLVFTVFSVMCGFSWGMYPMIVFRFLQGVGGSMMGAAGPIMIVRLLPKNMKGRGMALLAAGTGISLVLGPAFGGLITDIFGWQWIFFINFPLGVYLLIQGFHSLPSSKISYSEMKLDVPMVIYTALLTTSTLVVLENWVLTTHTPLLDAIMFTSVIIFVISLVLFIHRLKSKPNNPLINIELFKNPDFIMVSTSFLLTTIIAAGISYLLPFFLSGPFHMTTMDIGAFLSVSSVFTIIASFIAGRWCDSKGCKLPTAIAVSFRFLFSLIFFLMVPEWGILPLIIALIIMGSSFGLSGTSQPTRMVHHTKTELQGEASTFMLVVNYVGAALGNVLYAIFFKLSIGVESVPFEELGNDLIQFGFNTTMICGMALAVLAFVCTIVVKNIIPVKEKKEE